MREQIIDIIYNCTISKISIDNAADQLEQLFKDNEVGKQMTLFDQISQQEEIPQFRGTLAQLDDISIEKAQMDVQQIEEQSTLDEPTFDGSDIVYEFDHERLKGQMLRIYQVMVDGKWRTLDEVSDLTGDPHASVSAQLRNFRKPKFGGNTVNKRPRGDRENGLWEYQLIINRNDK